jgi:HD-GYP domain-containing protein (c-di-GMP phosphodiesterase class II)
MFGMSLTEDLMQKLETGTGALIALNSGNHKIVFESPSLNVTLGPLIGNNLQKIIKTWSLDYRLKKNNQPSFATFKDNIEGTSYLISIVQGIDFAYVEFEDNRSGKANNLYSGIGALLHANILSYGDPWHPYRVTQNCEMLRAEMGGNLSEDEAIGLALHDIGKFGLPGYVWRKNGNRAEWIIKLSHEHPLLGLQMLNETGFNLEYAKEAIKFHHRYPNGQGYPENCMELIPDIALDCTIADTVEACFSERPYREGMTLEEVRNIIEKGDKRTPIDKFEEQRRLAMLRILPDVYEAHHSFPEIISPLSTEMLNFYNQHLRRINTPLLYDLFKICPIIFM